MHFEYNPRRRFIGDHPNLPGLGTVAPTFWSFQNASGSREVAVFGSGDLSLLQNLIQNLS